jgi:hypothetical protein
MYRTGRNTSGFFASCVQLFVHRSEEYIFYRWRAIFNISSSKQ